ncbi:MAG: hypothetical protein LBL13_01455 [Bacteroidales bacterium]|jgi:hypothetical protein|nr:hypothetical protein [Bacteroidales bacterium]
MKRQLVLLILLFCCFSCASQKKEIIARSTIKLEGKNTKIRDLMEIDGYYTDNRDEKHIDNVMFFEDGTYVWSFYFKEGVLADSIKEDMSGNLKKWIDDKQIRWGSYWGVYRIEGDTIIGNYFVNGTFWRGWSFIEERYKIINKATVKKYIGEAYSNRIIVTMN